VERRIFIRDFRLKVSIGIHDFEKEGPQTVVVNVDLGLSPADKAHGDARTPVSGSSSSTLPSSR